MSSAAPALSFTGERFAPEVRGAIWYEHWHRYCLVAPLARGRRVLDAACGEGYGSYLLAREALAVTGVDIAPVAIAHADARYRAPNLRFVAGSCTALPLADATVDLVVSFETIEHLAAQAEMLAEFRRVLAPGGALVISSPNQPVYSGQGEGGNAYHVRELTRDELARLLAPDFPQQRWYGQRVVAHSALWREAGGEAPRAATLVTLADDAIRGASEPAPPMYFVVVCGDEGAALPELPALSLFDDGRQSLYRDYTRALLREKQLVWDELDARKIAEDRLAELIAAVNALSSEHDKTTAFADRVAALEDAQRATESELVGARVQLAAVGTEVAGVRAELAASRAALAEARRADAATRGELAAALLELEAARTQLAEVAARLAYRETVVGWLRWPLARLKLRLSAAG